MSKLSLLQYGESGTGKSIRAAEAAAWGPVLFLDFDGRSNSVKSFYAERPDLLSKIKFETLIDFDANKPIVADKVYDIVNEINDGKIKIATLVLDSWTAWESYALNKVMATNPDNKRQKMGFGKNKTISTPAKADYLIHSNFQKTFLMQLKALPVNLIINCHLLEEYVEETGEIIRGIQATGKLVKIMPNYFDEVHRTYADRAGFQVQTKPDGKWNAKTTLIESGAKTLGTLSHLALKISNEQEALTNNNAQA